MDGTSDGMPPSETTGQVQDALALFDVYGVPRPEALSLSRGRQMRATRDKSSQLCHSCGQALSYEQQCARCGHDFCYKCASELAGTGSINAEEGSKEQTSNLLNKGHSATGLDYGPSTSIDKIDPETPHRGSVTTNPFYLADRSSIVPSSAPQAGKSSARAKRPRRLSDCVPRRFGNRSPSDSAIEELSPRKHDGEVCGASNTERHSICCFASMNPTNNQNSRREDGLSDKLQSKINQLYRHAEDLHNSHHAMEHLATAPDKLDSRSDNSDEAWSVVSRSESNIETPTRKPRKLRMHNLSDDARLSFGSESNTHDIEQDSVASSPSGEAHIVGYSNRSIYTITSSGKAGSNQSVSGKTEPKNQELVSCPGPLALKLKPNTDNSGNSSQTARPPPGSKEPKEYAQIENGNSFSAEVMVPDAPTSLPDDRSMANPAGPHLPSMTGYKRHRQNTELCPRPQTPYAEPDTWPILKKLGQPSGEKPLSTPNSIPWFRPSLRKVSSGLGVLPRSICSTPSEWRSNLRKRDEPIQVSSSKIIPVGTPVSEWRRSLLKRRETTPRISHRSTLCESCNPTDSKPSTINGGTSGRCSHRGSSSDRVNTNNSNVEDPFTEPRLSVRAIEHSLAWKVAQEDIDRQASREADEVPTTLEGPPVGVENELDNETVKRTSPEPSPPCNWRDRYMNLRNEIVNSEDMLGPYEPNAGPAEMERNCVKASAADELGIEGLTIVVHMRDKDDLVINTDLNGREYKDK